MRIPALRTNIALRCYSTTTETDGDARIEGEESGTSNEESTSKELEAKNKEIIDLKVRLKLLQHYKDNILISPPF